MRLDYRSFFKTLNKLKIDYLVVGGLAVNFHGIPRMTYDIDLMILLEPQNIRRLVAKLSQWGYKPQAPVNPQDLADESIRKSWIQEKRMVALSLYCETLPIGEIDLVIASPIPYEKLKARAIHLGLEGEKVPVVSLEDLIKLKRKTGRAQDLSDVGLLKRIRKK
jgi:Nucleotidyl transferase AbiEii toxin, Type IV TA system